MYSVRCLVHLLTIILVISPRISAVDIGDIFTVQLDNGAGSCTAQAQVLEEWLEDCIFSIDAAVSAIKAYDTDKRVKRSMRQFFGIPPTKAASRSAEFAFVRRTYGLLSTQSLPFPSIPSSLANTGFRSYPA